MLDDLFFAYLYQEGRYQQSIRLVGRTALLEFLQENLYAEEVRICNASDQLLCQIVDGVDLINKLDEFDIDLNDLFHAGKPDADLTGENSRPKENWEVALRPDWAFTWRDCDAPTDQTGCQACQNGKRRCQFSAQYLLHCVFLLSG